MKQIIAQEKENDPLVCKNSKIRICTICGHDQIEFFEFGISCEECGSLLERLKC